MKTLRIIIALSTLAAFGFAQKEAPMPKDLPPYGPERPLQAPSVKSAKLDNGLTVWLVSEPGFPKAAVAIAVRGGLASDPSDRPGISELLAKTVDQGTNSRNARQVAEQLQSAGGDLTVQAQQDSVDISTAVLSSKLDVTLTLLSDVLQNASFPETEVTLAKRNLADSLRQRESEPSFLASRAMARVLFGDHPYHVTAATQESIAAATSAELRRIFAERFRPDQAILVAVGDFQSDKLLDTIRTKFSAWKNPSGQPLPATPHPSTTVEHAVFIVPRQGSVQTTLQLGTFGPLRGDPDYEATDVANAIYGGAFTSRLVTNIREDKGYTYSPGSRLRTFQVVGTLTTRADVRNDVTGPSLNEIEYELNRLATTTPTDEELAKAKRFLVGIEAIRLQGRSAVAGQLAGLWVQGLPPEQIGLYGQKVAATKSADVDAAARKYFPAHKTAIVAVGEEKVIREAVERMGIPIKAVP
jgi:zinc protease